MRVVLFGSGSPASVTALDAIAHCADVIAVVVPPEGGDALREAAQNKRVPVGVTPPIGVQADLICVATFPKILRDDVLRIAPAINVHWSLLPRHRGPDPLFWTYVNDDRTTGVTLHWLDQGVDTGPIVLQREIALERGRPIVDLYAQVARIGAELFTEAIPMIAAGTAPRIPQDERLATRERARDLSAIDLEHWPAERVWHVLSGVPAAYGRPRGYKLEQHHRRPGTIDGSRLYCVDGYVDLERLTWVDRALRRLRRLRPSAARG